MSKILIKNPLLTVQMNDRKDEFSGGHILIENEKIKSIGKEKITAAADEIINATNMVVLPGFINTHHHFYQTLTRNIPKMQNASLFDWLINHYEIWREITEEAIYISSKTAIAELMKSGTTTTVDHLYLFPQKTSSKLIDAEIDAAKEMGIRFYATRGSMSLDKSKGGLPPDDLVQSELMIQADTERLINKYHDESFGAMLRIAFAPCSPFSVSPKLMKLTAEFARTNNLLIHTHLAETLDEEQYCLNKFGQRPLDYVNSLGWIQENAWFAHAVHLSDEEIRMMGTTGCGISHCPTSNMRLGSGIARIKEMINAGINVSLAVDGSASNDSSNMLGELRNALLLSRLLYEQFWLTAREVVWLATRGGARVLHRDDIGELSVGKQADVALFSIAGLEYAGSQSDPLAALIFNVRNSPVDYLIVNGKIQVRKGKLNFDEMRHIAIHNRIANEMLERASKNTGINFLRD